MLSIWREYPILKVIIIIRLSGKVLLFKDQKLTAREYMETQLLNSFFKLVVSIHVRNDNQSE